MESVRKSSIKRHKAASIDRLSALPDEVICHILSLLPTKLSMKTSILGKRWRFLWAHVPNIEFNSEDHPPHSETRPSYSSIINRVMSLHKVQSLNTFRLYHTDDFSYCGNCSDYDFETCIASAISRNVRILDLSVRVDLPRCFLTCATLVDLRMYEGVGIPCSGAISLPSLKKLYFSVVESQVDLPRLLSGCPVLEELIIEGVPYHDSGCCNISSTTLKKLTFDFPCDSYVFENPDYRLKINAPALRYLKVCNCSYKHVSISPAKSILEADIWLNNESGDFLYHQGVLNFVDSLCNVKCLKLSSDYEFPDLGVDGSFVRFDKLTKLELTGDWRFLTKFLQSADHLEVLIIRGYEFYEDLKKWMEPMEERCACLIYSLRNVTIDDFTCTEQELNMVRYILKYARVLKRIEIRTPCHGIDLKARCDAVRRLASFHRGSKECKLAFC